MLVFRLIVLIKTQVILFLINHSELLFSSALPSVRKLWVSSLFPAMNGLLVQWESPTAPPSVPPVSHFAVEWCPKPRPSSCRLTTVDSILTSTVLQGATNNTFVCLFIYPICLSIWRNIQLHQKINVF